MSAPRVVAEPLLDVASARRLLADALAAAASATVFEVDLGEVSDVTNPGLQALLAVVRDLPGARLVGVTAPFRAELAAVGALSALGLEPA